MTRFTRKPPRLKVDNSIYFLTFCTCRHSKVLHKHGLPEFLIEDLHFYSKNIQELVAYTIMPDHIHLLVKVKEAITLSNFLRSFKTHSSKRIREVSGLMGVPIWQRGTMDHCIRGTLADADFENHLIYLFYNSRKHLGIAPKDFAYHNFSEMVKRGWLEEDFCDFAEETNERFDKYE